MPKRRDQTEWQLEASRVLKSRLVLRGFSYAELAARLNANGAAESYASIANKISRGTFSFAFFLQCNHAMEHSLPDDKKVTSLAESGGLTRDS